MSLSDLEDAFVNVSFDDQPREQPAYASTAVGDGPKDEFDVWTDHTSAKRSDAEVVMYNALRKLYPGHTVLSTHDWSNSILTFPEAFVMPDPDQDSIIRPVFLPLPKNAPMPGVIGEDTAFASYIVAWREFEFRYVVCQYPLGFGIVSQQFIIHKGPEANIHLLIVEAGGWAHELHNEIWVYEQGYWRKDASLWVEVQKANWDDVILKKSFKDQIQNDVNGFYQQGKVYKELGIPWKRGILMHGPPGNGKTISMKAIMKSAPATPLYVRTFQNYRGPEAAMKDVFDKARQNSPCLLVLEDLDNLIDATTRSFFLNQLDGLGDNDGMLIIGTTNYLDRIDPSLSKRPSRFDRKLLFDDPDREERTLYVKYWQRKLKSNDKLEFPDSLVKEIAGMTSGFSFAFLKEAFVSTLVLIATGTERRSFGDAIKNTIQNLRKEINDDDDDDVALPAALSSSSFFRQFVKQ
ncbi:P-loop containing nucleoside triphosphate hydrolase protein [Exidia glandulosa HHB12029]|uniref:p-loop containing nucleoside triphosphate hydrolase protein n=1 Tax=Exidia glandulosa HHB12029 TaxID=1314781 RepID=A0A165QKS2_EXIGL|nr:P-loop containing nucleoside triphosphate hydrolase protein [Exidia glandulosa HHB12029]